MERLGKGIGRTSELAVLVISRRRQGETQGQADGMAGTEETDELTDRDVRNRRGNRQGVR